MAIKNRGIVIPADGAQDDIKYGQAHQVTAKGR